MQISSEFNQQKWGVIMWVTIPPELSLSMEDFRDWIGAEPCGTTHWVEPDIRYEPGQCSIVSPAPADVAALPLLLCVFLPRLAIALLPSVAALPACFCFLATLRVSYKLNCVLLFHIFNAIAPQASLFTVTISASAIGQECWTKLSWTSKYFSASHGTDDLH